jgi:2-phospho-L-lactate transferase/gluconeogenesis factor (CofD/UPF0052 family)
MMQATHIIYCPGSIYGSVIASLLPKGVKRALKQSSAKKILISNLVSVRNETHQYRPQDYWRLFQQYTELEHPFEVMIVPDRSREIFEKEYTEIAAHYAKQHSHFLGWTEDELAPMRDQAVDVEQCDHYSLTHQFGRLRHDPDKLAKILKHVIA